MGRTKTEQPRRKGWKKMLDDPQPGRWVKPANEPSVRCCCDYPPTPGKKWGPTRLQLRCGTSPKHVPALPSSSVLEEKERAGVRVLGDHPWRMSISNVLLH